MEGGIRAASWPRNRASIGQERDRAPARRLVVHEARASTRTGTGCCARVAGITRKGHRAAIRLSNLIRLLRARSVAIVIKASARVCRREERRLPRMRIAVRITAVCVIAHVIVRSSTRSDWHGEIAEAVPVGILIPSGPASAGVSAAAPVGARRGVARARTIHARRSRAARHSATAAVGAVRLLVHTRLAAKAVRRIAADSARRPVARRHAVGSAVRRPRARGVARGAAAAERRVALARSAAVVGARRAAARASLTCHP